MEQIWRFNHCYYEDELSMSARTWYGKWYKWCTGSKASTKVIFEVHGITNSKATVSCHQQGWIYPPLHCKSKYKTLTKIVMNMVELRWWQLVIKKNKNGYNALYFLRYRIYKASIKVIMKMIEVEEWQLIMTENTNGDIHQLNLNERCNDINYGRRTSTCCGNWWGLDWLYIQILMWGSTIPV